MTIYYVTKEIDSSAQIRTEKPQPWEHLVFQTDLLTQASTYAAKANERAKGIAHASPRRNIYPFFTYGN